MTSFFLSFFTAKKGRDIQMEEKMEELQDHIRDVEKQNVQLKEKVYPMTVISSDRMYKIMDCIYLRYFLF